MKHVLKFKVDDFFIDCVEKLSENAMAITQQKFEAVIPGHSTAPTPWKFNALRRQNLTAPFLTPSTHIYFQNYIYLYCL